MTALPGLAPPASLRLGRSNVWGVDPSTLRVSVAGLLGSGGVDGVPGVVWATRSLPRAETPHLRWGGAYGALDPFVDTLVQLWGRPDLVLVEQPFSGGHHTEPASYYALAVVLAALGQLGMATDVELIDPMSWKLLATGSGYAPGLPAAPKGASAAERRKVSGARRVAEKARLMEWARVAGYTGELQDEADAVGIATAAGVKLETGRRS